MLEYYLGNNEIHVSVVMYDKDQPIAYALAYDGKRYQNDIIERVFMAMKPVYDRSDVLEDMFRYLSHAMTRIGKKELWFELSDIEKLDKFKSLDLNFQATYQYVKDLGQ